jgi:hypothetical protein
MLFPVTIETEAVDKTVESETQSRRQSGLDWTIKEVIRLIKELTSALVYLSEKVGSKQDLCCIDWSGDNIAYVEGTFKLRRWGKQGLAEFGRIDPVLLSPEMKECYVLWLSGQRALPQVDFGKAAVYSLALLAISLLSPELNDYFLPSDQLEEVVKNMGFSSLIQHIIPEMLAIDPALRPSPSALSKLLTSRLLPDPEQQLSSLSRAISCSDYDAVLKELEELWQTGEVIAQVKYPCSGCGTEIQLSTGKKLIDVCEKHLFCTVGCLVNLTNSDQLAIDSQCPVCMRNAPPLNPPKRRFIIKKPSFDAHQTCEICQRSFNFDNFEPWRMDLHGKNTANYCSAECYPAFVSSLERNPGSQTVNSLESLNCYMRRLNWTLPLVSEGLIVYFPDNFRETISTRTEQELVLMQTLLINSNPLCQCHFCKQQIENIATGRWVLCGNERNFVCSCDCFRDSLDIRRDQIADFTEVTCKTCGNCIPARDIEVILGFGRRKCSWCTKYFTAEWTSCGHQVCENCRERGCIVCDFVRMKCSYGGS